MEMLETLMFPIFGWGWPYALVVLQLIKCKLVCALTRTANLPWLYLMFTFIYFSLTFKPALFPLFSTTIFIQTQKYHPRVPVGEEQEPRRVVVGPKLLFCALFQSWPCNGDWTVNSEHLKEEIIIIYSPIKVDRDATSTLLTKFFFFIFFLIRSPRQSW